VLTGGLHFDGFDLLAIVKTEQQLGRQAIR
jgi:hypothetical protein